MAHLTTVPLRNALGRLWGLERGWGVHLFNHSLKEKNILEYGREEQIYCSTFLIKSVSTMEGSLVRY